MLPYNTRSAASSNNGGGILRKPSGSHSSAISSSTTTILPGRQVELLVFGYACKVFRDDAKARDIDQGKHLIPWMGDTKLKIDRYDVRGALSDLTPHEPPPGGYGNRLDYLTAEEQRAEQLCEEERYYFLYNNEEDHVLQQEEDLKRLQQEAKGSSYGRVGFQYEIANGGVQHGPSMNLDQRENNDSPSCDEPYIMPKSLQVPISILLPETMKQHAIIEKTARFIAAQGVQMEILLKAKQSNNVQFDFLAQNGSLNPYYKFILSAIKDGTYPPEETGTKENETIAEEAKSNEQIPQVTKSVITVPIIKYKPSANCAYTQLISKIKGVPLPDFLNEEQNTTGATSNTASGTESPSTPILLQYNEHTYVQADEESNSNSNSVAQTTQTQEPQVEILKNSSALALAQGYSSDSESEEDEKTVSIPKSEPEPILNFPIPSENLKNIIDKTATYVIKNGRQFEETLRTKSEERFTFLIPENEFYAYYMYKITGDPDAASKERKTRKAAAVAAALLSKKGITGPVSFSIKAKDEANSATLPPALPQEPSDEDEDDPTKKGDANGGGSGAQQSRNVPEHVQKAIQLVESQLMARNAQFAAVAAAAVCNNGTTPTLSTSSPTQTATTRSNSKQSSTTRSRFDLDYNATSSKNQIKTTKTEQERNAIYEQQQQNRQKELKKAEEKVKDKLAQIAREKLGGIICKDKQLQLERKRKAMAFLNQIKGAVDKDTNSESNIDKKQNESKTKADDGHMSDSSEVSVHSIPITSYGPDDDDEQDLNDSENVSLSKYELFREDNDNENGEKASTVHTTTVLLSDDDDVQLISESKAISSASSRREQGRDDRKRSNHLHSDMIGVERKRRKKSIDSNGSHDTSSSTIESQYSTGYKHKYREHNSRHHDDDHNSMRKAKKSKKTSKSKKKKKHKSRSRSERSPSEYSQRSRSSRHSKRSRHASRSRSRSGENYSSSESDCSTASKRYKTSSYELKERVSYTPPASPRASRTSHKTSSKHKERRRHRYDH